jgi:hypothetical protein
MFQVHTPDDGSIFLSFSVYLDRSHSSFPFFLFFVFFFLLCFILFCFPFPFLVFFPPPTYAHVPEERKKRSECQLMAQLAAKYKENKLGPAPARISRRLPWKVCQFIRWKRVEQIHSQWWNKCSNDEKLIFFLVCLPWFVVKSHSACLPNPCIIPLNLLCLGISTEK